MESLKCSSSEPRASRTPTSSVRSLSSTKDPIFDPLFHDLIRSANENFSFFTNIVDFLAFLPFLDLAFASVLDFGIRCEYLRPCWYFESGSLWLLLMNWNR